jgi:hypothetical protein
MTNQTRKPSQGFIGIKALIIVMSMVGTICGWTLLAANQVRETLTTQAAPAIQAAPNNLQQNQPSTLRQVSGTSRPAARTRSSR